MLLAEAGDAERRRPHVDAAAAAAEVERHADDVDGFHQHQRIHAARFVILYDTDMPSPDGDTIVVKSDGCV